MKKLACFFQALVLMTAWGFVGCSDDNSDPTPVPPPSPEEQNFVLSVKDITTTSCVFTVEPADAHMSYIAMLIEKEEFDAFASGEACIEADLKDFAEEAEAKGVTLDQLLINEYLHYGRLEVEVENELDPGAEYYLYAYGLSETGEATTALEKLAFQTEAIPQVEVSFDIRIENLTLTGCTVAVTATPASVVYFINVIDEPTYQEFGANEEAFVAYTNFVVKYNVDRYGATPEALLRAWGSTGSDSVDRTGLKPGSTYYAYAVGVNSQFQPNSKPGFVEFKTESAAVSDNTFTAEFDEMGYTTVSGTILPTNNDPYLWGIQSKEEIDEFYAGDAEVMEALSEMYVGMGMIDSYLSNGRKEFSMGSLQPETDYYLLIFGWDQAPTTELTKIPFTTAAAVGDPKELVLDIQISNVNHKGADIAVTPSNGAPYYYDVIEAENYEAALAELGSADAAVMKLIAESIEYAAEWNDATPVEFLQYVYSQGPVEDTWSNGDPETEYVVFGCAIDLETAAPAAERGFINRFTTTPHIVSDAAVSFEMGKFFDSTALAESDPDKYGNLPRDYAVMNYTLVPNASAAHWYSNFYMTADYVNYFTDEMLIQFLVDYGYDMGNPDGVVYDHRNGTYVLPWHQEYSFVAVAVDENGVYGPVTREVVLLSPEGASPADEFVPSFQSIMKAAAKSLAAKSPLRASRFFGKKL